MERIRPAMDAWVGRVPSRRWSSTTATVRVQGCVPRDEPVATSWVRKAPPAATSSTTIRWPASIPSSGRRRRSLCLQVVSAEANSFLPNCLQRGKGIHILVSTASHPPRPPSRTPPCGAKVPPPKSPAGGTAHFRALTGWGVTATGGGHSTRKGVQSPRLHWRRPPNHGGDRRASGESHRDPSPHHPALPARCCDEARIVEGTLRGLGARWAGGRRCRSK